MGNLNTLLMDVDDFARLNSATKYPSIPTYHALDGRGGLLEERLVDFDGVDPAQVVVTEKLDGCNARIVVPPSDGGRPLVGSRTELLTSLGDLIANPAHGIVAATRVAAEKAAALLPQPDVWVVLFGEVYGGSETTKAARQYSGGGVSGFRVFDMARVPVDVLDLPRDEIATWRDRHAGQRFVSTLELSGVCNRLGLPRVPSLAAQPVPVAVADTHAWLAETIVTTQAPLDQHGAGHPEGVVVRTVDRSRIAKIRFEDYERHERVAARAATRAAKTAAASS